MKIILRFKKKDPFELLFLSLSIASLSCIFLVLILIYFKININIILSVISPIWMGTAMLIFTAWKDS
ncbi:hypothetical protein ACFL1Y_01410 [Patescibacteria group bacterium]